MTYLRMSFVLGGFRRLLLQIGGANTAGAARSFAAAAFLTPSQPAASAKPDRSEAGCSLVRPALRRAIRAQFGQVRSWVSGRESHEP
jgi:hypothetical protein